MQRHLFKVPTTGGSTVKYILGTLSKMCDSFLLLEIGHEGQTKIHFWKFLQPHDYDNDFCIVVFKRLNRASQPVLRSRSFFHRLRLQLQLL